MPTDFTSYYRVVRDRVRYHFPRASPDDVVQQACYEFLRYYGDGHRQVAEPSALLWTIARAVASRPKHPRPYSFDEAAGIHDPPSPAPEPWRVVSDRESAEHLRHVVAGLQPKYAAVLEGHYLDGKSCEELARKYGVTKQVIKTRLSRGRRALRMALGDGESP